MRIIKSKVVMLLLLLAGAVFAVQPLVGQNNNTTSAHNYLNLLSRRLNLSATQQKEIKPIINDEMTSSQAINKDRSLSAAERTRRTNVLREESASKIRKLLNDDQKQEFDAIQKEMLVHTGNGYGHGEGGRVSQGNGQGFGQGYGEGHGCKMPDADEHVKFLSSRHDLSPSQQEKITTIIKDQLAQLESIGADKSLSVDSRAQKVRALREETAVKVRDQLNNNQKRKFDESRQDVNERIKERRERGEDCS